MALILKRMIAEAKKLLASGKSLSVHLKLVFLMLLTLIKTLIKHVCFNSTNSSKPPLTDRKKNDNKKESDVDGKYRINLGGEKALKVASVHK